MCLAVPMKVTEIHDDRSGVAELDGARYAVNLNLIENPQVGDFVIVHTGFAIERLDAGEADLRLALFDEIARSAKPGAPS